ncbi:uncharacterized protein LOC121380662 [Gigantopelta aegis]|uniref:uncharacterized protein LOC121380662 n=1 Tax=Gigantopelta aegis TaxID=1735272 RepID=UPI001B88DD80|nr:uncharacterized protein LOC121380662 [Gigantopelta aegis]
MHCLFLSLCGLFGLVVMTQGRSVESNTNSNHDLHRLKRHLIKGLYLKRSVADNRVESYSPHEPFEPSLSEDDVLGEQLMEEFLTFLTLKDSGFLDMCFQKK